MITTESYWRKTGAKFMGSDKELQSLISECNNQHAWTNEEGYFNSFLCLIDCKKCDKICSKHRPKLNEDIAEFFYNCCNFERVTTNGNTNTVQMQ